MVPIGIFVLIAVAASVDAKKTCYGKILNFYKTNLTANEELQGMLEEKQFDEILLATFEKVNQKCGKEQSDAVKIEFLENAETIELVKDLLGHLSVEDRLQLHKMVIEENRLGVYSFFTAKALNFFTNPHVSGLVWKLAGRMPQLSMPRTSF